MRLMFIGWSLITLCSFGCEETGAGQDAQPIWPADAQLALVGAETRVEVSWPEARDDERIERYEIQLDDGEEIELSSSARTHTFEMLAPARLYRVSVRALDSAQQPTSRALTASVFTVDQTSPSWPDGAIDLLTLTPHQAEISWSGSVDHVGVAQHRIYLDDKLIQRLDPETSEYLVDGLQPATTYTLSIEARDEAGYISDDGPSLIFTTPDEQAPVWLEGAQLHIAAVTERSVELVWEPAIDDVAVVRYELIRDDEAPLNLEADSSHVVIDELDLDTTYTFSLVAIDGSENRSAAIEVVAQTSDVSAPTWPLSAAVTLEVVTDTSALISWTPAEDQGELTGYEIRLGVQVIGDVDMSQTAYELTELAPGQVHLVSVVARDNAGQRSAPLELTIQTTDSIAPEWATDASVELTQPQERRAHIRWPEATDNVGVTGYRVDVDDMTAYMGEGSQRHVDLTELTAGMTYGVSVYARDQAGQWSDELTLTFQASDQTQPHWETDAMLSVEALSETELEAQWPPATDNVAVSAYLVYLDDQPARRIGGDVLSERFTDLDPWSTHWIRVEAEDSEGHLSQVDLDGEARTLDETPPTFQSAPALRSLQVSSTAATLGWSAADDQGLLASYTLYQEGVILAEVTPTETEYRVTGLTPSSSYTFALEAVDAAGNQSALQTTNIITPDGARPTWPDAAQLTVSSISGGEVTLSWTEAQDDVNVLSYHLFHQNVLVQTVEAPVQSASVSGLTLDQTHVFRVEAEDASGQMSVGGPVVSVDLSDQTPPAFPIDATFEASLIEPRSVTLAWTPAVDDVSVVSYRVEINGALGQQALSGEVSVTVDSLDPLTEYTFQVFARDAVGQESSPLSLTITTGDVDAPQWADGSAWSALAIEPDSAQVAWASALGEVTRYIIRDGSAIEVSVPAEMFEWTVSGLTPESTYSLTLIAVGPTELEAAHPINLELSTPADVPPAWPDESEVTIIAQAEQSVTIEWPLLGADQRVGRYHLSLDSEEVASVESGVNQYTFVGLSLGESYVVTVNAENTRGQRSIDGPTASVSTRDITAPTFAPDGAIEVGEQTVTTLTLSWPPAFDNVGVVRYAISLDDVLVAEVHADQREYRALGLEPGTSYNAQITALDEAGLESPNGLSTVASTRSGDDIPTDEEVRVALSEHCALCHDTWFSSLEAFQAQFIGGRSGDFAQARAELDRPFISLGAPHESLLIELLEGRGPEAYDSPMMPPTGFGGADADFATLSASGQTMITLLQIRDWIEVMEDTP